MLWVWGGGGTAQALGRCGAGAGVHGQLVWPHASCCDRRNGRAAHVRWRAALHVRDGGCATDTNTHTHTHTCDGTCDGATHLRGCGAKGRSGCTRTRTNASRSAGLGPPPCSRRNPPPPPPPADGRWRCLLSQRTAAVGTSVGIAAVSHGSPDGRWRVWPHFSQK